jgi:diguanylate cyclase (GGDEF)-like protein/PAS domain S-box-containing protein
MYFVKENFEDLRKIITDLQIANSDLKAQVELLQQKLEISSASFLNIVGKSVNGIIILNHEHLVVYTNYAAHQFVEEGPDDIIGKHLQLEQEISDLLHNRARFSEVNIKKSDGSLVIAEISVLETEWEGSLCYVLSFLDITERKQSEEMLEYMSKHDYLTDLPNRIAFEKNLKLAMLDADNCGHYMALLYLDLDNFKMVNDTLGHDVGDILLKEVSILLTDTFRFGDNVARLGGDEFAITLFNLRKPEYAASVAKKIIDKFNQAFILDQQEIYTSVSIGIAVYPLSGDNPIDLVKNADTAMYSAKRMGKNRYQFFSRELNKYNEDNLQIINGLRTAVQDDELLLMYQPIIDLANNKCSGIEALVRWQHPVLGLLTPDKFIAIAEDCDAILEIGTWVINQALTDFAAIASDKNLLLAINVSAKELEGLNVTNLFMQKIHDLNIAKHRVLLELTETSLMSNPAKAMSKFRHLSEAGVKIAVDDFGTGYSSLSYLKKLPLSILKIDKSFIADINKDENSEVIINSTIQLAHSLGLQVVAEGVESSVQLDFLRAHQCNFVQGFYFSAPLLLEDLIKYLQNI